MARHQIIYTSCMRGIDSVNDGQQIYSYDAGFSGAKNDEVKSLFTYQTPSLQPGVIMTEELALAMPSAFSCRLLNDKTVSVTLNTYLGRDYMGSAGRFGNHLSHSVICDVQDMNIYPCELYGSSTLRSSMAYEEVNSPEAPAYLPEPILEKGYQVDTDHVIEFLGIGENLEYYKMMVCAMLKFPAEKKRIVICDEADRIIMWIAALEYALPLETARKVNITTYEFDPELSTAQICGVVAEGSRYNAGEYVSSGRHYVFDFINFRFSDVEAANPFVNFLDTAFSFSYDSLTEFHDFIVKYTRYREADEDYYGAYDLYCFLRDGIAEIHLDQFRAAMNFTEKYGSDAIMKEIVCVLVKDRQTVNQLDHSYALYVLGRMLGFMKFSGPQQQAEIKQMIVDRLILSLSDDQVDENTFLERYNNIDELARSIRLSIPEELMKGDNRTSLLSIISHGADMWKKHFMVRIISDYVKDIRLPLDELYPDRPIGSLYFGIIQSGYGAGQENGHEIVEKVIDNFRDNGIYMVNMTWNMEGFLEDLGLGDKDKQHLWNYFIKTVLGMDDTAIHSINMAFMEYKRFDSMFSLYEARVNHENNLLQVRQIFKDTFEYWFAKSPEYGRNYSIRVLGVYEEAYEKKFESMQDEDCFAYAQEILRLAMNLKVDADYVDMLIDTLTAYLPLKMPDREHKEMIGEMLDYQCKVRKKRVAGRLLLFCTAIEFYKMTSRRDIKKAVDRIVSYSGESGVSVTFLGEKAACAYLEWVLEYPLAYRLTTDDYTRIYKLFVMPARTARRFMEYCCKASYKKSKEDKNYESFSEYLRFMFENGNREDIDSAGKYLCKLSRKSLDELNDEMSCLFYHDRSASYKWDEVREVAESTNPLLNNLSGLFKRRRD